ncbi:hypothetical protein [Tetragenococcus halophilus]|nr:hypothetical protein [Tetragenococcus halophilus]NWO00088.1 hypothetical protein [Tetragenococcus halophilus]
MSKLIFGPKFFIPEGEMTMNNLRYFVEENKLILAFTSNKSSYEYTVSLKRSDKQFGFHLINYEEYDDYNLYQFGCSLTEFAKFLQEKENSMVNYEDDINKKRKKIKRIMRKDKRINLLLQRNI